MPAFFDILIIGLALSADSFSAALAMGLRPHEKKNAYIFGFSSGGAEAIVACIGALAGSQIAQNFSAFDHWISFSLLIAVALHMFHESYEEWMHPTKEIPAKFHSYTKILIVSLATSLDAFAVGVGLGVTQQVLWPYIISIGVWAFFATLLGMSIGKRVSRQLGPLFSFLGALILVIMAIRFLMVE
jgi:putative Mn2+ efflux pump MntP